MIKKYALLIVLLISLHACKKENMGDCFKSTGSTKTEHRFIANFNSLEVKDKINVYITFSSEPMLSVTAGENLLDLIRTDVKDGKLIIENDNRCNWVRSYNKTIDVMISTPKLRTILFYGSGQLNFENQLKTDTLFVNLWEASGDLNLFVDANYVELKSHTGTGTIFCKGNSTEMITFMGANGIVNALNTNSDIVLAVNENTGLIKVNARSFLKADIKSIGNIEFSGSPQIQLDDRGSGSLIQL